MEEGKRIKSRSREPTDRERFCRQVQGDDGMTTSGQADAGWSVSSQSMTRSICCRQAARVLERLEDPILFLRVSSFVRVGGEGGVVAFPSLAPRFPVISQAHSLIGGLLKGPRWKQWTGNQNQWRLHQLDAMDGNWEGLLFPFQPCRARNRKVTENDSRDYHTVSNTPHTVSYGIVPVGSASGSVSDADPNSTHLSLSPSLLSLCLLSFSLSFLLPLPFHCPPLSQGLAISSLLCDIPPPLNPRHLLRHRRTGAMIVGV
ncbi:uncharacterized protein AKAW2_50064S [Aspergillus luchuensis]|uniref:Uncharacterized protein n=1 Tax=Aspergillus kawachii TaxID=1069201 RepID=A0A7R8A0E7_ASPKA|nr:uncharacterized protein AKAW2_50064S [Aspergillus luchuensis]BCR99722.1 hypothetical protein AKAW2_50064S [Aspergillus luchuensis]